MATAWDRYQERVRGEMRKLSYSEVAIDHALNPRNLGEMTDADGYASVTGPCGDTINIWLRVRNDIITGARFTVDGCTNTTAAASVATEMLKGKRVRQALLIGQDNILSALGGLPEGARHCALLAANTVKAVVKDYLAIQKEPWRKAYRQP